MNLANYCGHIGDVMLGIHQSDCEWPATMTDAWARVFRKVGIAVVGFTVLAAGVAMIVLPGPAVLVIPLGLTILAKEYPWARQVLDRLVSVRRRCTIRARLLLANRKALRR